MKMRKNVLWNRLPVVLAALTTAVGLRTARAETVTSEEARTAVGNWLTIGSRLGCRLGASVSDARTCTTTNGASFHVVRLSGGGFVVTSADTEQEPVVAFSPSDDLVESEKNPLWTMLCRDFAGQAKVVRLSHASAAKATGSTAVTPAAQKWARLLPAKASNGVARLSHAATGVDAVSDVRVAPLLETRWSQEQDSYYSNMGDPCYNYYTPNNYPCGCVATATAQIMRYHRFPTGVVAPGTYACRVNGAPSLRTMQGGVYAWNDMPAVPADGTTPAQRNAIGKLTSDVGIACLMDYGPSGSSAGSYMAARCLPERFGYASAVAACSEYSRSEGLVCKALRSNLNAKLPVLVGLSAGSLGHAVVADGYGYSLSTFYVHFNFGWAGKDDAWYAPPNVAEYSSIDSLVYNIYPQGPGDGVICSGRVTDAEGKPKSGADVTAYGASSASTKTDAAGVYAFVLSPGTYTIASGNASRSVTLTANVGTPVNDNGSYAMSTPVVSNCDDVDLAVTSDEPVEISYTVTFDLGEHGTWTGGGDLKQTVKVGGAATEPTFDVAEGWRFTGWDATFDVIFADLTVKAEYAEAAGDEPSDPGLTDYAERTKVVGDFEYKYWIDRGTAVITAIDDAEGCSATTLRIPATLDGFAVAKIGRMVLADHMSVVEVTLPDSLKTLGESAFACYHKLSRVTLNEGLETIETSAFHSTGVNALHVPASVTNLLDGAFEWAFFSGGHSPVTIDVRNANYVVKDGCVYDTDKKTLLFCPPTHDSIEIPDSVEFIAAQAFNWCGIRELSLGRNVREIRQRTTVSGPLIYPVEYLERVVVAVDNPNYSSHEGALFDKGKTHLLYCPPAATTLTLPATVVELDTWLLSYNSEMERYVVESGNPSFGSFDGCLYDKDCRTLLAIAQGRKGNVALPASMTGPADLSVFMRNVKVETFTVEAGNTAFEAHDGCLYDKGRKTLIFASPAFTEFTVASPVERIGSYAFSCHREFTKVTCADSVKSIGMMAFECTALEQVDLGQGVERIEDRAFDACNIRTIVLPTTLKYLGWETFSRCGALRKVYFCGNAPELGTGGGTENLVFAETSPEVTTYVLPGTTGWNGTMGSTALPAVWPVGDRESRPLTTWDGLLPSAIDWAAWDSPWAARDAAVAEGKLMFVLSGADWCPWTDVVKEYIDSLGVAFTDFFALYYCNVDTDEYGMSDGVPSYGVFAPELFDGNWSDGLLAYNAGGVAERVQAVLDDAKAKSVASWTISYDLDGGVNAADNPTTYGFRDEVVLAAPTREGYVFLGWEPDDGVIKGGSSGDKSFTATWDEIVDPGSDPLPDGGPYRQTVDGYTWTFTVSDGCAVIGCVDASGCVTSERAVSPAPKGDLTVPSSLGGCPVTEIGYEAFYECANLEAVTIPAGVRTLGWYAFSGCSRLHAVRFLPGTELTTIGAYAFRQCSGLGDFEIPSPVTTVGTGFILGCSSLSNLVVATGNASYVVSDGFLLTSDRKTLIGRSHAADEKILRVPEGVETIKDSAFYASDYESVVFPVGIRKIGYDAFSYCERLRSAVIPAGLEKIAPYAFSWCQSLTNVTFLGDAPTVDDENAGDDRLFYVSDKVVVYVSRGSSGWDVQIPGTWQSRPIAYIEAEPTEPTVYAITYDLGGGVNAAGNPSSYAFGESVVLADPTRVGYVFADWEPSGMIAAGSTGDRLFTARWKTDWATRNSPWTACDAAVADGKLLFVLSGADWCPFTDIVKEYIDSLGAAFTDSFTLYYCNVDTDEYGMAAGVPSYGVFVPEMFNGNWSDGLLADNSGGVAERVQAVLDEAKAKSAASWKISYDLGGGVNAADNPTTYGFRDEIVLAAPTREGYVFLDWEPAGGVVERGSTGDRVFTARWSDQPVAEQLPDGGPYRQIVDGCMWTYRISDGCARIGCIDTNGWSVYEKAVAPAPRGHVAVPSTLGGRPVVEIGYAAFLGCSGLESVTIPAGVRSLGMYAFANCGRLETVKFDGASELTSIGFCAFERCKRLGSFEIPAGVDSLDGECFSDCASLTNLTVAAGSDSLVMSGDFLLSADRKTVFCCTLAESATRLQIPDGVEIIAQSAFHGGSFESVELPPSVRDVQWAAFEGCLKLGAVVLPEGLSKIGAYAFGWCYSLTNVTFLGDAPTVIDEGAGDGLLFSSSDEVVVHVSRASSGWGTTIPGTWQGRPIDYFDAPPSEPAVYAIAYDLGGGVNAAGNPSSYAFGEAVTLADPTRVGYVFLGWEPGGTIAAGSTGDRLFTARWKTDWTVCDSPWTARDAAVAEGKLLFVLSGADWCYWTDVVKDYIDELGTDFTDFFTLYYCNVDTDKYGMADGVPSYGAFDPAEFNGNWSDGCLAYASGGVAERVQAVLDKAKAASGLAPAMRYTVTFDLGEHGIRSGGGELVQQVSVCDAAVAPEVSVPDGWWLMGWDTQFDWVTGDLTVKAVYEEYVPGTRAGSWTTDVKGAKEALDARLFVVLSANFAGCGWSRSAQEIFEDAAFLSWAASNGVYLVTTDESRLPAGCRDAQDASSWFWSLYYTWPERNGYVSLPTIAVAKASKPNQAVGLDVVREDGESTVGGIVYDGTVSGLIKGLSTYLAGIAPKRIATVTFDANGGAVAETSRQTIADDIVGDLPTAKRKGWRLVGWFTEREGGEKVTAKTVVPSDVTYYAQWTEQRETAFSGIVGVAFAYDLGDLLSELELSSGKCSLKKQPAGIKADAAKGLLTGVPTKAGAYAMTVTDSQKGQKTVSFTVAALPAWAVGTFSGFVGEGENRGTATVTVGKTGKASGKFVVGGRTWSFVAASFAAESTLDEMILDGTAKSGSLVRGVRMALTGSDVTSLRNGTIVGEMSAQGDEECLELMLWRNVWKDAGAASRIASLQGLYTVQVCGDDTGWGYLSLKIDAKGGVKATGKLPDGVSAASSLALVSGDGEGGDLFAVWTAAPSAYKGGSVTGLLRFGSETLRTIEGDECFWSNLSPTATGEYGAGFFRNLELEGAYYGTAKALADYAEKLAVAAEPCDLQVSVKYVESDENGVKTTWTERESVSSSVDPSGLELTVGRDGKIVTSDPATKPQKDRTSGEWTYNGKTDAAFKMSLAKATGVFKGSFTCWYDYLSESDSTKEENGEKYSHASKKVSFEGVWVQGASLRGFYLSDCLGEYEDERTGAMKTYAYKESHPFTVISDKQ